MKAMTDKDTNKDTNRKGISYLGHFAAAVVGGDGVPRAVFSGADGHENRFTAGTLTEMHDFYSARLASPGDRKTQRMWNYRATLEQLDRAVESMDRANRVLSLKNIPA